MSVARYWVHYGFTPRSSNTFVWSGVGRVVSWKGWAPGRRGAMVLRVMVARSSRRRVRKLCTGSRSGVALLDLAGLAIGLAEQDGGRGGSVGDGFDVHGYASCTLTASCQNHFSLLHGYNRHSTNPETLRQINCLARMSAGNQGELRLPKDAWKRKPQESRPCCKSHRARRLTEGLS